MKKPYKAEERDGYWIVVYTNDAGLSGLASYPATKSKAKAEAAYMNRVYAEALAGA